MTTGKLDRETLLIEVVFFDKGGDGLVANLQTKFGSGRG
jgi:hypothetical protein